MNLLSEPKYIETVTGLMPNLKYGWGREVYEELEKHCTTIAVLTEQLAGLVEAANDVLCAHLDVIPVLFRAECSECKCGWKAGTLHKHSNHCLIGKLDAAIAVVEEEIAATSEPMPVPGRDKYDVYLEEG